MNKSLVRVLVLAGVIIGGYFLVTNQNYRQNKAPQPVQKESITSPQIQVSTECSGKVTASLTEGPYYKTGSLLRINLREDGVVGEKIIISGYVFNEKCEPIEGVWLDFWQADGQGVYDNAGYKLRGHQFTGKDGKFLLETVVPGRYPGRTPHIHVKLQASQKSSIITSQLFMPGESQNQTDSIFNKDLIMDIKDSSDGKTATFNFVIND